MSILLLASIAQPALAKLAPEAVALVDTAARESGRPAYTPENGVKFTKQQNVFVRSALAVDFTYRAASVTLPLFRGKAPDGSDVFYIITDTSDFETAKRMGLNYAPKMAKVVGTQGAQTVTVDNGIMTFRGNVDFSPKYEVTPGDAPTFFPPKSFTPGARGDAEWSSMAVLPSGVVLNVQMVQNASGAHDRMKAIDLRKRTVTLSLLDGVQNGKQYYYHLVTDVSADLPSVLEKGVYTPRLAMVPAFGKSEPGDNSALLGFSPVLNGSTQKGSGQDQGFSTSLANMGIDPINVFPLPPHNEDASKTNNYSPLWDAHVSMWTEKAIAQGKVHRIYSLDELKALIKSGMMTSAMINPPGATNGFVGGLRPTKAIINCPVIAQPDLPKQ
ncbi:MULTISPECIES: DUF7482 domain-containing protein [Sphingosinicellaceae]|uniref:DUF7482 domain-containing protein n=1 Tax=Sphingosinicellaceae TaxID=2820280 RepID=UPI001C1E298E|nr:MULTISPECIES: hypothetical protein [Polymorphobacter]QYE35676.1 hypothetical protein KZX46_06785 [Polymorphobacter sp. PAMC 29334]UAJ10956.1 hypothetical protein KTC28_04375 [Polymorphobacter megasporae]